MRLELTRRGDYAVRAMLALVRPDGTGWLSVNRIAGDMSIPARFLPAVMRDLTRAGLVEARTGRAGGYRLARAAERITLLDVIDAVEPADEARQCVLRGIPCGQDGRCAVHDTFDEARAAHRERLARATLASLTRRDRPGAPADRGPSGPRSTGRSAHGHAPYRHLPFPY